MDYERESSKMTNEQYYDLIQPYEDASRMLLGRLELLNRSLYGGGPDYGPIHNIQSRIKEMMFELYGIMQSKNISYEGRAVRGYIGCRFVKKNHAQG